MKIYKCDICGKHIDSKKPGMIDGECLVKFRVPFIDDARRSYAGIEMKLKSNSISDLCPTCIKELLNEAM